MDVFLPPQCNYDYMPSQALSQDASQSPLQAIGVVKWLRQSDFNHSLPSQGRQGICDRTACNVLEMYMKRPWHAACRARGSVGRFGYIDLKEAALRGGLCIFYRTATGGLGRGTGVASRVGRSRAWTMQKRVVLKQLRMVVGIVSRVAQSR